MRVEKSSSSISRVRCVVHNCYYNDHNNSCLANSIEIQPPDARDTEATDCATFVNSTGR
ncbi:MAG: DUF1540 domain-containing protein [Firmicutes bacterium]|nr:DUF1540 domain-containing protein [Bacillota bacterium]